MLTLKTAPRDVNELLAISRGVRLRLALQLNLFDGDDAKEAAFNAMSNAEQSQALLEALLAHDRNLGTSGGAGHEAPAPAPVAPAPVAPAPGAMPPAPAMAPAPTPAAQPAFGMPQMPVAMPSSFPAIPANAPLVTPPRQPQTAAMPNMTAPTPAPSNGASAMPPVSMPVAAPPSMPSAMPIPPTPMAVPPTPMAAPVAPAPAQAAAQTAPPRQPQTASDDRLAQAVRALTERNTAWQDNLSSQLKALSNQLDLVTKLLLLLFEQQGIDSEMVAKLLPTVSGELGRIREGTEGNG